MRVVEGQGCDWKGIHKDHHSMVYSVKVGIQVFILLFLKMKIYISYSLLYI